MRLADGSSVELRPIQPDDAAAMLELHSRLSDRTRYLRFFTPYPRVPAGHLHRFVTVDHHDREALVVVCGPRLLAVGRYDRLAPGSPEAEVAVVVEDAYQGRGIGSVLLARLAEAARENGIRRFVGEVLWQNAGMLRMLSRLGDQVRRRYADGLVHIAVPIAQSAPSGRQTHTRQVSRRGDGVRS